MSSFKLVDNDNLQVSLNGDELEVSVCGWRNGWETYSKQIDRRALLANLLDSEGLPGVEEIAKYQAAVAKIPEIVAKALRQIDDKEDEIEWLRQQLVDALAEKRRREGGVSDA